MAMMTTVHKDPVFNRLRQQYIERLAKEYHETHKDEYETTSPYALTRKLPTLRIVDNVLTSGSGHTDPISSHSTVIRGFFGGVKGISSRSSGGGGRWEVDSKVQFDKVYLCPETGREFTDADMEKYREQLRNRCRYAVEDRLKDFRVEQQIGFDGFLVSYDGRTDKVLREAVMSG